MLTDVIAEIIAWVSDHAALSISILSVSIALIALVRGEIKSRRSAQREMVERVYLPLQKEVREILEPFQSFEGPGVEDHPALGGMSSAFAWEKLKKSEPFLTTKVRQKRREIENLEEVLREIFAVRGRVGQLAHEIAVEVSASQFASLKADPNSWGSIMINARGSSATLLPEVLWFSERTIGDWVDAEAPKYARGESWSLGVFAGDPESLVDRAGLDRYISEIFQRLESDSDAITLRERIRQARALATEIDKWISAQILRAG